MSSPFFAIIVTIFGIVISACNLLAAFLLLRERNPSTWMILCGSILQTLSFAIWALREIIPGLQSSTSSTAYMIPMSIGYLGNFLFSGGLLWFAVLRRNQASRIAELETILMAQSAALNPRLPSIQTIV